MYRIHYLNAISPEGTALWSEDYTVCESQQDCQAFLVRSASLHEMNFSDELLAIARAGAGVNNIPIDRCTEQGIVVFNTPGASTSNCQ